MAKRREKRVEQKRVEQNRVEQEGKDVMHGRDFAGVRGVYATEDEQTRDRQRVVEGLEPDEAGEVTDAEVEARESRRAERAED